MNDRTLVRKVHLIGRIFQTEKLNDSVRRFTGQMFPTNGTTEWTKNLMCASGANGTIIWVKI